MTANILVDKYRNLFSKNDKPAKSPAQPHNQSQQFFCPRYRPCDT